MQPEAQFYLYAIPFLAGLIAAMLLGPGLITALKRYKIGQKISTDGPESHKAKEGTPTMGGLIILGGIFAGVLAVLWIFRDFTVSEPGFALSLAGLYDLFAVLLLVVAYALVGLVDDYLTIKPVRGVRGISSKPKAAIQFLLALAFVMWLATHRPEPLSPVLYIAGTPVLSGIAYWIFSVLFIAGMANFVNICDGLDGLVSGLTAIAGVAFVLTVMIVPPHLGADSVRLMMLLMATVGACIAFLWFNANPAKVFMGDTGALALGVALPAIAIITHREVLMIVIGMVFILDGLSSALQWAVFKYTRIRTGTGRRVFKKSPIHHHFELSGWPEQNVVIRFWIVGVIFAVIAFAGAAWRLW